MPELPEVETTRRGIEPALRDRTIARMELRERRLRWPVPRTLPVRLAGRRIEGVRRRAKYLLVDLEGGALVLHLGMSGSLRVLPAGTPTITHDHYDLVLDSGQALRFNDPRRFGCLLWVGGDPLRHRLLAGLGPEPFDPSLDAERLAAAARGRKVAVKQFLMDQSVLVGVGNIYASESLFRAGVDPRRAAGRVGAGRWERILESVREVLGEAIRQGGSTLRDYVNPDGAPGYFAQNLDVYERTGLACHRCGTAVRHLVQGQRSTYYCPTCQR
ncbi:MAG: bifunctional DNA-formamidopyrimidine glycosylase/DNA-(apurinic or apyrimidinic site) lyase [Steroidobacteraceae bacterium]